MPKVPVHALMVRPPAASRHTRRDGRTASVLLAALLVLWAPCVWAQEPVRAADTVEWRRSPDGKARVKVLQQGPHASLGLLRFEAGAHVPPHNHPDSDEMLYLESGTGVMLVDGQELPVRAGDAIRIPAGTEHSFTAGSPGQAVQVYTPPGPEQRFLQWPVATPDPAPSEDRSQDPSPGK